MRRETVEMANNVREVLLFLGCHARYIEPEVGKATIQVLRKNGFRPLFPNQKCCAAPKLSSGGKGGFIKKAMFNINSLLKTDQDVVTDCTSCALTIKREYPDVLKNDESKAVAQRTYDIMEYLVLLRSNNSLDTNFNHMAMDIYYHPPCHLRMLGMVLVDKRIELMKLIPGINLMTLDDGGCCGMGGTFGFKNGNYEMSMAIGRPLFEEIKRLSPAMVATECSMCKIQIEQGTGLKVIHPVQIIKKAYGI